MKRNLEYYDGLPWRVIIDPERQDYGKIIFVASHPEFDGVLGTGETPETALADLRTARRSMIEALLAAGYRIPEPAVAPSAVEWFKLGRIARIRGVCDRALLPFPHRPAAHRRSPRTQLVCLGNLAGIADR